MNNRILIYAVVLLCSILVACTNEPSIDNEPTVEQPAETGSIEGAYCPIELSRAEEEMMQRQNGFAIGFFNRAVQQAKDENAMYSPFSAAVYLSMLANGTAGESQTEILNALDFEESELDALNEMNARVCKGISSVDSEVATNIANSMWIDTKFQVKESFISSIQDKFGAQIFNEPLCERSTMEKVNAWANEQTEGMIPKLLDNPLTEGSNMMLMNALYFNGVWNMPFNKEDNVTRAFHNADGTTTDVEMMCCSDELIAFHDKDGATWLKLKFGNRTFGIYFILPDEGKNLHEYFQIFNEEGLNKALNQKETTNVNLYLPKFNFETTTNGISDIFKSMGINKIFTSEADFSGISNASLHIDRIIQKTKIEIDEEGAKAAGITHDVWVGFDPDYIPKYSELSIDRPFAFIIQEESTRTVLFIGQVCKF